MNTLFAINTMSKSLVDEIDKMSNKIKSDLNSWVEYAERSTIENGKVTKTVNVNMSPDRASLRDLLEYFVQQDEVHEEFDGRSELYINRFRTDLDLAKGFLKTIKDNSTIKYKPCQLINPVEECVLSVSKVEDDVVRMNETDVSKVSQDEVKLATQLADAQDQINILKKELAAIKKGMIDKNLEETKGETVKFPEAKKRLRKSKES